MTLIQKALVLTVFAFASGCAASAGDTSARRPPMLGGPSIAALPAPGAASPREARPLASLDTSRPREIASRRASGPFVRTASLARGRDCPQCR